MSIFAAGGGGILMADTLTSNTKLGPKDHLCPKCGAYVMCDNDDAFVEIIERLRRERDEAIGSVHAANLSGKGFSDSYYRILAERDRLRAALEQHRQLLLEARDTVATYCQNPYGYEQVALMDALLGPADETPAVECEHGHWSNEVPPCPYCTSEET